MTDSTIHSAQHITVYHNIGSDSCVNIQSSSLPSLYDPMLYAIQDFRTKACCCADL